MATHINPLIRKFLKEKTSNQRYHKSIQTLVNKHLPTQIRDHITFESISKKKLLFKADSSSSAYVFNLKRPEFLRQIQEKFPQIEGIKIKVS